MYCPVDGAEYREGYTRCPEHDVKLVEEPPEVVEEERLWPAWLTDWDRRRAIRVAFIAFVVAATVYVLGALVSAAIIVAEGPQLSQRTLFDQLQFIEELNSAVFKIGLGLFGVLAGSLALEAYLLLTVPPPTEDDEWT